MHEYTLLPYLLNGRLSEVPIQTAKTLQLVHSLTHYLYLVITLPTTCNVASAGNYRSRYALQQIKNFIM